MGDDAYEFMGELADAPPQPPQAAPAPPPPAPPPPNIPPAAPPPDFKSPLPPAPPQALENYFALPQAARKTSTPSPKQGTRQQGTKRGQRGSSAEASKPAKLDPYFAVPATVKQGSIQNSRGKGVKRKKTTGPARRRSKSNSSGSKK